MKLTLGGFPVSSEYLQSVPVHIPDDKGGSYRTELVLYRSADYTEKILWWHSDDPRKEPHNHPWWFESSILSGGYTESRYWLENGELKFEEKTYRAGDVNIVPANVYHVVYDVQPQTVTHLRCGVAREDNAWGYLNLETLEHIAAKKEVNFWNSMVAINPHLKKW